MNIQRSNINTNSLSFSGHKKTIDKTGYEQHNFYYVYDPEKYKCEVELFNLEKDKGGNFSIADKKPTTFEMKDKDGRPSFSISKDMSSIYAINSSEGFAYRFKLTDKSGKESYAFDNGSVIGIFDSNNINNKYNVVLNNRATINKNGPMQLIMPDLYYPGIINQDGKPTLSEGLRAKALASVRTHANKLGGTFYGIIERLPEIEKEGISRIVGTPFTRDTISSHLYWTENAYQVAPTLGSEEEFKDLQKELFKHGINWIADAALVNEGFGGIHLSELLRKGPDSVAKDMFRADEKISLGILPDKSDYTRMKVINAPFVINASGDKVDYNNTRYDASKPTYVQFYDDRLASPNQKYSMSPLKMTTYENKNTDNIYDITHHDDAVYPFPIEVSPEELTRNVKQIMEKDGKIDLSDIDTIKKVTDFTYFNVVNKSAASGLEVWDGNVDIAKLNFYRSDKDDSRFTKLPAEQRDAAIANFDRGALAVRDYAINSGKYWTKLTSDTQFEYASTVLSSKGSKDAASYMEKINKLVEKGLLPKLTLETVDKEVIQNVLDGNYHLRRLDDADMRAEINPEPSGNEYRYDDYILRKSTELPLETLPVATNLLEILTSPYIAKRANTEDELGISRYDLTKAGNPNLPVKYEKTYSQMDDIYQNDIVPLIQDVISGIDGTQENGMVSDFGKYVISEIAPDLTKYILVKSLNKNADIKISNDGDFDFSKVNRENITMQSIGIPFSGKTGEEEAEMTLKVLRKGISDISKKEIEDLKEKVSNRFKNRTVEDFEIAEMIMDRTESGLGWRIDAAKDIASIDAVRDGSDNMTKAWNNVIDFWKLYNQTVLQENPHAYTTAEITDLCDLFRNEKSDIFKSDGDAERKFLQETGITAVANYNYFFSLLPELFAPNSFEHGAHSWMSEQSKNFELRNKLDLGWTHETECNPGFLFQSPEDGVVNSYTFMGNHDKPRVLHGLALDMGLFYSSFSKPYETPENDEQKKENVVRKAHRATAAKVLRIDDENSIEFDKVNAMAIAMGDRIDTAVDDVIKDKELNSKIKQAVSELAEGSFKGKNFDATAFGTRPFEIAIKSVLDQVEFNDKQSINNRDDIEAKMLQSILEPAFDRFYSMYKLLITLPGSPTDFAGDRVGASGFETKAKNYHQQNRNVIHWEWLNEGNDNKYKFVKNFYNKMNQIANIRNKKELSALNDGATVSLPILNQTTDKEGNVNKSANELIQGMLRYNDEGSVVLTLHDLSGSNTPITQEMNRKDSSISNRIVLDSDINNAKQGLKHGLQEGTTFKNLRENDNSLYKIAKMNSNGNTYYYLRRENEKGEELPVTITKDDYNTLILYKI